MTVVRQDAKSIFIVAGGYTARPGDVPGYSHAYAMGDGGLRKGDRVKARHIAGTPLTRLTLESGAVLYWHHDD